MISIEADFSFSDLEKDMQSELDKWFDALAQKLMATGRNITDQAIAKVKTNMPGGSFGNITYNLRSSIGCGLVVFGEIKEDYFPFGKGDVGQQHGRELMAKVATGISKDDIGLIFVAGEKYGVFVQQKGYDVTDMSWISYEKLIGWEQSNG